MKDQKPSASGKNVKNEAFPANTAPLGRDIQAKIGERLRAMYGDVVDQGVPDRFVDLLNQIGSDKKPGNSK